MSATHHSFDVLIIGSGLAGLTAALRLAPTHRVAVITKRGISDGSSNWAQVVPPLCGPLYIGGATASAPLGTLGPNLVPGVGCTGMTSFPLPLPPILGTFAVLAAYAISRSVMGATMAGSAVYGLVVWVI